MDTRAIVESGSDYVKFGNGLLIQWGLFEGTGTYGIKTITFPKPFQSYVISVIAPLNLQLVNWFTDLFTTTAAGVTDVTGVTNEITLTSFKIQQNSLRRWIAFGF